MSTSQLFAALGALVAFTAVAAGAFGGHFLRSTLLSSAFSVSEIAARYQTLNVFEIAVRYQMYHALALFATAWTMTAFPHALIGAAGWLFVVGTIIFSGSLYVLSLTDVRLWGAITPIGGVLLLIGWTCLFLGILFSNEK